MRSKIYATEIVANRERRFGSATAYYPATLVRSDGSHAPVLFTEAELSVAADRARVNPEDLDAIGQRHGDRRAMWITVALLLASAAVSVAVIGGALSWIG